MFDSPLVFLGAALILTGATHIIPAIALWDARAFRGLHRRLRRWVILFQALWPLGRTPFTLAALALTLLLHPAAGLRAAVVFAAAATLEWGVKASLRRPRPFTVIPDTEMLQPKPPHDPSFPSGDALRVWFLATTLPITLGLPLWAMGMLAGLAILISLGRVAMGAHYPLDVLAGAGLGLLATGATLALSAAP